MTVEFPEVPNSYQSPTSESSDVTFCCSEEMQDVILRPLPASVHLHENKFNFQYNQSLSTEQRHQLTTFAQLNNTQFNGWVMYAPEQYLFCEDEPGVIVNGLSTYNESYKLTGFTNQESMNGPAYLINTFWTVDLPENYSILITQLFFTEQQEYRTLTHIVDIDQVTEFIKIPIFTPNEKLPVKIKYGDPIGHVIPIHRDIAQQTALID